NLENLKMQQLLLYFAPANGQPVEIRGARLGFKAQGDQDFVGGPADSIDGVITTRGGSASSWGEIIGGNITRSPIGEWELALPNDQQTRDHFKNEEIEDILFVITYAAQTPAWPV